MMQHRPAHLVALDILPNRDRLVPRYRRELLCRSAALFSQCAVKDGGFFRADLNIGYGRRYGSMPIDR